MGLGTNTTRSSGVLRGFIGRGRGRGEGIVGLCEDAYIDVLGRLSVQMHRRTDVFFMQGQVVDALDLELHEESLWGKLRTVRLVERGLLFSAWEGGHWGIPRSNTGPRRDTTSSEGDVAALTLAYFSFGVDPLR